MKAISQISAIIILFLFSLSGEAQTPSCLGKNEKNIEISWGQVNNKNKTKVYKLLTSDMIVTRIVEDSLGKKTETQVKTLQENQYCAIKDSMRAIIIKHQSISFPGDTQQFLMYQNPNTNLFFRAIWNIEFTNFGNKDIRRFFNELDSLSA
jgi:hypothetical protein